MISPQALLKQKAVKITQSRLSLLCFMAENRLPLSAEELYRALLARKENVNLSTVYRALELFCEKELVEKDYSKEQSKYLYLFNSGQHKHHLVCMSCNKRIQVEGCPLREYEEGLEEKEGFRVARHHLEIYGYCRECHEEVQGECDRGSETITEAKSQE